MILKVLILLFISFNAIAWDGSRCWKWFDKNTSFGLGAISTTAQSTTSTGDCKIIGKTENDKKIFISQSMDSLKIEAAQGAGEHLNVYAFLSNCNKESMIQLPIVFQKNYSKIYGVNGNKVIDEVYESMDKIIKTHNILSKGCRTKG